MDKHIKTSAREREALRDLIDEYLEARAPGSHEYIRTLEDFRARLGEVDAPVWQIKTFHEALVTLETLDRLEGEKLDNRDKIIDVMEFLKKMKGKP